MPYRCEEAGDTRTRIRVDFSEPIWPAFLIGGAIALAGVYVGAFLHIRPRRTSSPALPECLPVDACARL